MYTAKFTLNGTTNTLTFDTLEELKSTLKELILIDVLYDDAAGDETLSGIFPTSVKMNQELIFTVPSAVLTIT